MCYVPHMISRRNLLKLRMTRASVNKLFRLRAKGSAKWKGGLRPAPPSQRVMT